MTQPNCPVCGKRYNEHDNILCSMRPYVWSPDDDEEIAWEDSSLVNPESEV